MSSLHPVPAAVLLTGERASARSDLARRLAVSPTAPLVFESYDLWEIVGLVPRCALAIIDGDLDEAPACALVRLLTHRHPALRLVVRAETLSVRDSTRLVERGGVLFPASLGDRRLGSLCESLLAPLAGFHVRETHTA